MAAYNICKNHECEPCLNYLTEFVDQETIMANNPIILEIKQNFSWKSEKSCEQKSSRIRTMAT